MFSPKSKTDNAVNPESISILSSGAVMNGDFESNGDIRVDGRLNGNLHCNSKILIGPKGIIEGNISGNNADILGTVKGNIKMSGQLNLQGKAIINGDINVARLQIESTVCFNGKCIMGASIVELSNEQSMAVNE